MLDLFKKKQNHPEIPNKPLRIVKHPDPLLDQPSKPITVFDSNLEKFALDLLGFSYDQGWGKPAGFAAVQAGVPVRMFIALGDLYINPEIIWMPTGGMKPCREGCYSLEENRFDYSVNRAYAVKLKWQDLDGQFHEDKFTGFKAQVIQHEMDHLEGRLCCGDQK